MCNEKAFKNALTDPECNGPYHTTDTARFASEVRGDHRPEGHLGLTFFLFPVQLGPQGVKRLALLGEVLESGLMQGVKNQSFPVPVAVNHRFVEQAAELMRKHLQFQVEKFREDLRLKKK